jgi:hypothetical protein
MATGTIILPVQAAKIAGAFVGSTPQIEGGDSAWKLLYDASTEEEALWQFRMPANYSTSPVLKLQYSMASAITGAVAWNAEIMAVSPSDAAGIGTSSFDAVNVGSGTVAGTASFMTEISVTLSSVDSMVAEDLILLKISRDPADAGDTATGDAELLAASIEYTTT